MLGDQWGGLNPGSDLSGSTIEVGGKEPWDSDFMLLKTKQNPKQTNKQQQQIPKTKQNITKGKKHTHTKRTHTQKTPSKS